MVSCSDRTLICAESLQRQGSKNSRLCLVGIFVINVGKTWEKLVLAARVLATIDNPNDVCVISARPYGHRAVLKYAGFTGAQPIAGRFTPGNFTNYITRSFKEPRVIVITDPRVDHQAIREAAYVNIPLVKRPIASSSVAGHSVGSFR